MFERLKSWWSERKWFRRDRDDDSGTEPFIDPKISGDFEDDRSLLQRVRERFQAMTRGRREPEPFPPPKKKAGNGRSSRSRSSGLDLKKLQLGKVSEHAALIRWALIVIALFLLSEVVSRIIAVSVRPTYTAVPRRQAPRATRVQPRKDYGSIESRNMFNVEGTIPEPFDQGMLDCFAQARPSSQPITLLGTIVMKNERYSVALVQEGGNAEPTAVRKDDSFFNKYTALKVDRRRLCLQVRATQDLEYIEMKDDTPGLDLSPSLSTGEGGISAASESEFTVKRSFLDSKLANLNEILQTARAVPYVDASGAFKGFLVQSIQQDSLFYDLGVRQGDILTGVNDIQLDNAGKGLEAFQQLRNSPEITLEITRGGQPKTLNYKVQ